MRSAETAPRNALRDDPDVWGVRVSPISFFRVLDTASGTVLYREPPELAGVGANLFAQITLSWSHGDGARGSRPLPTEYRRGRASWRRRSSVPFTSFD